MGVLEVMIPIKKHYCDFCGKLEDFTDLKHQIGINTCRVCGKDVCNWCIQAVDVHEYDFDYDEIYVCPDCKDKGKSDLLMVYNN